MRKEYAIRELNQVTRILVTLMDDRKVDNMEKALRYTLHINMLAFLKKKRMLSENEYDRIYQKIKAKYKSELK